MQKPIIALKKVSHSKTLSEETPAYSAQVWVDGAHFCDVTNHGTGGPDDQHPPRGTAPNDPSFRDALKALDARIGATFPKFGLDGEGDFVRDLETVCHELLDRAALEKEVKRDLSKKVMFVKPTDGQVYGVKLAHPSHRDQMIAAVKKKHGIAATLNELPLDAAVRAYEKAAGLVAVVAMAFFLLAAPTSADAHPNHSCHFHGTVQHCR